MEKLLDKIQNKILILKRKKAINSAYLKPVDERYYVKTITIQLK